MNLLNYGFTPISKIASATSHSEQPEGAGNADDGLMMQTPVILT